MLHAYVVALIDASPGSRARPVIVHAPDEATARERGANMLGVSANAVTATAYSGPTLGSLSQ